MSHRMACENSKKNILVIGSYAESLVNFRGTMMRAMVSEGHRVIACAPEGSESVRQALSELGVEYRDVYFDRAGLNPLNDLKSLIVLFKLLRDVKPDMVLCYTIKPVLYGSYAARFAGVNHIYSMISGLGYAFSGGSLKRQMVRSVVLQLYRNCISYNEKVFFQNPDDIFQFKKLRLLKTERKAVLINGSGVDVDFFADSPLPSDMSFLMIARLIREKGIFEYVAAARLVKQKYPEARFLLAGWIDETPDSVSAQDLRTWKEEGVVEFLGKLDDVRPAISTAAVYVLPSYREGTPRTVLEAMSMGRPVITSDAPGCRETVVPGMNGFLVPIRDVAALALVMEQFVQNPDLVNKMGIKSREIALEKYDVHKVNKVILGSMDLFNEKSI